ncbi:MAG TPA: flagellar hook-basal body complex protein FliE [Candidatus Bathyarchaeia archaeon]|nr:flagellar hook-basal body complex protein FliE [Candidatus Bathyarchaeia archaeon]
MADPGIVRAVGSLPSISPVRLPSLGRVGGDFGAAFRQIVSEVNSAQVKAQQSAVELASGRSADTAQAITSIQKADISFQFALQIRNKLLEAYQDLMRLSV